MFHIQIFNANVYENNQSMPRSSPKFSFRIGTLIKKNRTKEDKVLPLDCKSCILSLLSGEYYNMTALCCAERGINATSIHGSKS
jgi:hypothetical protein